MKIIIDFGTNEEKKFIRQEFKLIYKSVRLNAKWFKLNEVYFTSEFENKVNELLGINTYKSSKGFTDLSVDVQGKIIDNNDKSSSIVFSSSLFINNFDQIMRFFAYFHEIAHIINKIKLPIIENRNFSYFLYMDSLRSMYDEYFADRFAYDICDGWFPVKSEIWNIHIQNKLEGFIKILEASQYYEFIKLEIAKFRIQADVKKYCFNVNTITQLLPIITVHTYSILDQYPTLNKGLDFQKSPFLGSATSNLMEFLKMKFHNKDISLEDGLGLVEKYYELFGVRFEEKTTGSYCHVLDI